MNQTSSKSQRPLSPHLGIYKPQISSVLSILHRITGVFLSAGALFFGLWIFAAAYNIELFQSINIFSQSIAGAVLLIAWSGAFYYHLWNGIRHLYWDTGRGLDVPSMTKSGIAVIIATVVMTVLTWIMVWGLV